MSEVRQYHESTMEVTSGPFGGDFIRGAGALCPDGKRRNAHATYDGIADTFFSIPAYVYAKGKRVYGYITVETVQGYSTPTEDDPATVKFRPFTYRKNHRLVEGET